MKDLEDFFDTPGLSHIGEQIIGYLGFNELWNLRQVNKYWKNVADLGLTKLKAHYDSLYTWHGRAIFPALNWHSSFVFWKKRGIINYMRFHEFFKKYRKEHQFDQDPQEVRKIWDVCDYKTKPARYAFKIHILTLIKISTLFRLSMEWPVKEGNIELLKILLPGCPNDAGTQEDNETDLIQFAKMACRMTDNLDIINTFLDHCDAINLRKNNCIQVGFESACAAGNETVAKRLIEVSEEDGIKLRMGIVANVLTDMRIQGEIRLNEASFPCNLNIAKILVEASRDKKVDLTLLNSLFELEIVDYPTEGMRIKGKAKEFQLLQPPN